MRIQQYLNQHLPVFLTWPGVARNLGLDASRIETVRETPLGIMVTLRIAPPLSAVRIGMVADLLSVAYSVARVRVLEDPLAADRVILYFDTVISIEPTELPVHSRSVLVPLPAGHPIPIGLDDDGEEISIGVIGQGALVGGIPGSGKSNALRVLLAGLANQRDVALFGIDPKQAELVMWQPRLSGLVLGHDPIETIALLEFLLTEIQRRALYLSTTGRATLKPSREYPAVVLIIDEWAEVAAVGTKQERQQVETLLRRYVSLGRAVGCSGIFATLRPTAETTDVTTRSLLAHRFALRCGDRHQADAILGVGTYEQRQLVGLAPGRALWSDGGPARAVQFYEVNDGAVPELVMAGYRPF